MYKFIYNSSVGPKVKREFNYDFATWMELVQEFQRFLEECGYIFVDGFDMSSILSEKHRKLLDKEVKKRKKEEDTWE